MNGAAIRVHTARLALLGVLLLAFALRLHRLAEQELRGDETFGYFFSLQTPTQIIQATIDLNEPHPIASYIVQHGWLQAVGISEFALRFTSVWFGVAAVALLYRLGRLLGFALWTAWLAALLGAFSPYAIWHSQDARMYSMSLALTLATVYLTLEALQRRRWPWTAAYLAAAWLALHTHYYAFFVLVALTIFLVGRALVAPAARPALQAWIGWNVLLAVLYLPWLARASDTLSGYHGNGDSPALPEALWRAVSVFAVGESTPADQRVAWALLAALLLLLGVLRLALGNAADRRALWLLLCYLLTPLLLTWWGARDRPIFDERYLIAAAPAFFLLIAAAADLRFSVSGFRSVGKIARVAVGAGLVVLAAGALISLSRHYSDPAFSKTRGWRDLAALITQYAAGTPADQVRIAQNFPDPTLWYYSRDPLAHVVLPPVGKEETEAEAKTLAEVAALVQAGVTRVILPVQPAANWDDRDLAATALADAYDLVAETQVGVWPLQVYAGPPDLARIQPLTVTFANGIQLVGISGLESATLPPGGLLTPTLFWNIPLPADEIDGLKVTLQLLGPDGRLVAQHDQPLINARPGNDKNFVKTYGILLPDQLSPGSYTLITALYTPSLPGAPRILTTDGADDVVLVDFVVEE